MPNLLISDVRPWGGEARDLLIADGRIREVLPTGTDPAGVEARIDGRGLLAVPGFVNAHAHVDKSWWGKPWVPFGGDRGSTQGRIAHERAVRDGLGIPSLSSTVAVLREFLRHGTTAVRSHVDVDLGVGLRGIETVREAVAELGGAIDVEIVAFPQDGVVRRPGVLDLLDRAAAAGAEHIGGLDPASIDRDPVAQLDGLFEIAVRHDVGIDIHLHDGAELGAFQLELIAERTVAAGRQGRVNIAHGFALGDLGPGRRAELVARAAEAGLTWTTVAPVRTSPLPWREMRESDVAVGLGTDGIRDLWSPYGDGDLLAIAQTFARLHGLVDEAELTYAMELATRRAGRFVGRREHDLVPGARADLVLLDAENVPDAVVRRPVRELVVAGGSVVAERGEVLV